MKKQKAQIQKWVVVEGTCALGAVLFPYQTRKMATEFVGSGVVKRVEIKPTKKRVGGTLHPLVLVRWATVSTGGYLFRLTNRPYHPRHKAYRVLVTETR